MKFQTESRRPDVVERKNIVIDSDIVGWVQESNSSRLDRYHVGLYVGGSDLVGDGELIQGHGDTIESAIEQAFARGLSLAEKLVSGIEIMKDRLE